MYETHILVMIQTRNADWNLHIWAILIWQRWASQAKGVVELASVSVVEARLRFFSVKASQMYEFQSLAWKLEMSWVKQDLTDLFSSSTQPYRVNHQVFGSWDLQIISKINRGIFYMDNIMVTFFIWKRSDGLKIWIRVGLGPLKSELS